jgi:formate-nitrite transporter family protein
VAGTPPNVIWDATVDEGERRLKRSLLGLSATALVAGLDIGLGLYAAFHVQGALGGSMSPRAAHEISGLFFGIAFVFIAIGRSELFTENFLVPVSAVWHRKASVWSLARLWGIALVFNLVGLLIIGYLLLRTGMLEPDILPPAGEASDTLATREFWPAFASGILGGTIVTMFTWLILAADTSLARIAIAILTGFLLHIATMNHIVVAFGALTFGMWADTAHTTVLDVAQNTGVAFVSNMVGGLAFVTVMRLFQVRGEPVGDGEEEGGRRPPDEEGRPPEPMATERR